MPQGSLLGPVSYLVDIDDLAPGCPTHKYVDDTTISEILNPVNTPSHMSKLLAYRRSFGSKPVNVHV